MASKQLGKFKQWAEEKISSTSKTVLPEDFRDLEQDVELRRIGIERMHAASEAYHRVLIKRVETGENEEASKLLPVEGLGLVMISHGDEFGPDSAFGQSMVKMGRAHCKIAVLQETYAESFHENFVLNLEALSGEVKEYQAQRKKLDSRRLTLDAAAAKSTKSYKKEKDKKEAEEEARIARVRFEEMAEDIQARMFAIQENEINQLRDLTQFLSTHTKFVQQYLDILMSLKDEWPPESTIRQIDAARANRPVTPSRAFASRSTTPVKSSKSQPASENDDDDDDDARSTKSGKSSKSTKSTKLSRSRKNSIAAPDIIGRKRANSTAAIAVPIAAQDKDKDGIMAESTASVSRSLSVAAGWASSAVNSVPGFKSNSSGFKKKDGNFAALDDNPSAPSRPQLEEYKNHSGIPEGIVSSSKRPTSSRGKASRSNSSVPEPKKMKALYDFTATGVDEMDLHVGDEITVLDEVSDGWWLGTSLTGARKGLFPVTYTEEIARKPPLPTRTIPPMALSSDSEGAVSPVIVRHGPDTSGKRYYDPVADDPFSASALSPPLSAASQSGFGRERSYDDDDDDEKGLFGGTKASTKNAMSPGSTFRRLTSTGITSVGGGGGGGISASSTKKPPPPPPPARRTQTSSSNSSANGHGSQENGANGSTGVGGASNGHRTRSSRSLSAGSILLPGFAGMAGLGGRPRAANAKSPFDGDDD